MRLSLLSDGIEADIVAQALFIGFVQSGLYGNRSECPLSAQSCQNINHDLGLKLPLTIALDAATQMLPHGHW